MPASPLPGSKARSCACHPLHTAPSVLRRSTTHSTSLAPGWPVTADPASALWRLFTNCPSLAHRELEQMCFATFTSTIPAFATTGQCYHARLVQMGYAAAATMRPACVAPVQYFLCDRKAVALRMDDTIPATPMQTSTIVLPVRTFIQKGLPGESDKHERSHKWEIIRVHLELAVEVIMVVARHFCGAYTPVAYVLLSQDREISDG